MPASPPDTGIDPDWFIAEREYRRQEQRRGRRHAYELVDPRRTALVVLDLVPFFVEHSRYARAVVPRVNRLSAAVRDAAGTVAWVVPGSREPNREGPGVLRCGGRRGLRAVRGYRRSEYYATLHTVYRSYGDGRSSAEIVRLVHASR